MTEKYLHDLEKKYHITLLQTEHHLISLEDFLDTIYLRLTREEAYNLLLDLMNRWDDIYDYLSKNTCANTTNSL